MNDVILYLSPAISFVMMFISIMTYIKARKKEEKKDIQDEGAQFNEINTSLLKANMKLDQVCSTTNETRTDIKALNKDISSLDKRISNLELRVENIENERN